MNLRILFCDDDNEIMTSLHKMVLEYFSSVNQPEPECELFNSGEELLASGAVGDIAFLDVEMDGLSGIHTGERLKKLNPRIKIIIVTSFSDYLDEAMKFHVFRYLSKPVDKNRLFRNLKEALYQINTYSKSMVVETDCGYETVYAEDIVYIESCGRKAMFHTVDKNFVSIKGIDYWTKAIDIPCFYSTNRGCIVNMKYVSFFNENTVTVTCECFSANVYIARRRFKSFRDAYLFYVRSKE
ncbi:MAG: response regulator transcription factor [Oscillospiraceae bacterium]|nr:response regulator transcription factor [Oscillospiraceae bacterium]